MMQVPADEWPTFIVCALTQGEDGAARRFAARQQSAARSDSSADGTGAASSEHEAKKGCDDEEGLVLELYSSDCADEDEKVKHSP